ncbi:hypothetical protein [Arthrobacter sp. Soil761]|uniref:hypothetical protein n=1 Tax=Arthrobacter sp. Soil761 TaxID=1736400 RepID=UPI0006F554D2|nr:hypothetical protein [Arthrobacter sp. Soil761]KRE64387.1 hypothetical protein ASG79_15435 [Arthrobacter sp. Soil761]
MVEVTVKEGAQTGKVLDAAIQRVADAAQRNNIGILVTDLGPEHFIIRAHPVVPAGFVRSPATIKATSNE